MPDPLTYLQDLFCRREAVDMDLLRASRYSLEIDSDGPHLGGVPADHSSSTSGWASGLSVIANSDLRVDFFIDRLVDRNHAAVGKDSVDHGPMSRPQWQSDAKRQARFVGW